MLEWLASPIDPSRAHELGLTVAWHGRLMVVAWGFLLPLGVLVARFFKVVPRQDWPTRIDNKLWWHLHLTTQYIGGILMLLGLVLVAQWPALRGGAHIHGIIGYAVVALGMSQFLAGWLRGSKGGPTEPNLRGDHYDMTLRRKVFEYTHKSLGYLSLILGCLAIGTGLWQANAPRWMWLVLSGWWLAFVAAFALLQYRGRAIDTYQAIWGPDADHPGNRMKPIGWGVRRLHATGKDRS